MHSSTLMPDLAIAGYLVSRRHLERVQKRSTRPYFPRKKMTSVFRPCFFVHHQKRKLLPRPLFSTWLGSLLTSVANSLFNTIYSFLLLQNWPLRLPGAYTGMKNKSIWCQALVNKQRPKVFAYLCANIRRGKATAGRSLFHVLALHSIVSSSFGPRTDARGIYAWF